MVNDKSKTDDSYNSLLLLEEISREETLSQRDLSKRLGIAVGLVNSYLKNMVAKGLIRVKSFPRNRYAYLLTPKGISEKGRLTYQHLHYFTNLYTTARKDFQVLFARLEEEGVKKVLFCGVDEVAEIAYLSLQETDIELEGIVDGETRRKKFFHHQVKELEAIETFDYDHIVLTSLKRRSSLLEALKEKGFSESDICQIEYSS